MTVSEPATADADADAAELEDPQAGALVIWMAIMTVAFLAILGLVVDGGAALATRERAADLATQAARAGADALVGNSLRATPASLAVNRPSAVTAAREVLTDADVPATATSITVDGDQISVTVRVAKSTVILSAVGLSDISQTASASATAIFGGTTQEGG